ncbi:MAG: tetratricopeptide repeat protein [Deltaproteobacteria bacterium]|nr:tetratricopeptide repeat protein [Deltaproteobacteria bacterium]
MKLPALSSRIFFLVILLLIHSGKTFSETTPDIQPQIQGEATPAPSKETIPPVPSAEQAEVKAELPPETVAEKPDYLKQGTANLKEENYEEAVDLLKRARELDPESSVAAFYLGVAYKKIQDYKEARAHLKDAITLSPAVKEAVMELADVSYQLGNMDEALETLEIAEREEIAPAQAAFLKGLVLLKQGKNSEAIESFKKSKSTDIKLATSADYQIGVANLQEGRLSDAREIFKEIIVRDPNSNLSQFANQYIEAITRRLKEERPFRISVGLQYQYDDNVLLKPGESAAAVGITDEADSSAIATLRAEYSPRFKGPYAVKAQYSLYLNDRSTLHTHDVQSHTIALIPGYNLRQSSISLLASYNYTLVHDEKYLQAITATPSYTFTLTGNQYAQVFYRYTKKEYLNAPIHPDEDRNGDDNGLGASWFYLIMENRGFVNFRYEYNREDTEGVNWKYSGNKAGLSFLYPVTDRLKFKVAGEAYLQDYENLHTSFVGMKRKDETYTGSALFSYNFFDEIDVQVQYAYIKSRSNIAVYDYSKNVLSAGVEVRF